MQAYIAKRLLLFIPTVILLTALVFVTMRLVPGDPALNILVGPQQDIEYTQQDLANLRAELGTDKPIYEQYVRWIWGVLHLDFGITFYSRTPIVDDIKRTFPVTLELSIIAILFSTLIAVPLGVLSAVKQDSILDYATRILTIAGISIPNFWLAILMIFFLVWVFGWIAPLNYVNLWEDPLTNLQQMAFPAIALGINNVAFVARVTRSTMLEVLREDYIRTARSKGLAEKAIIYRHALKNALLPVITVSGYQFGGLLGGTIIIENIFLIPGMGRIIIVALQQRDYVVIQSVVILIVMLILILNMVLDVVYGWVNPRIRFT